MKNLEKLLSIASAPLGAPGPNLPENVLLAAGRLATDLSAMLRRKNGCYAFEGALHIFPSISTGHEIGIAEWNQLDLWRSEYDGMADAGLFFAEDIFGGQFCIYKDGIFSFDPETGEREHLATTIDGWAEKIVNDYDVLTGYPLAHAWQLKHGMLPAKTRLLPKIPFVVGGEFSVGNLYELNSVDGMKFRAQIAKQIRSAPDGSAITFDIIK